MGNCNFKTEQETDNVTCKISLIFMTIVVFIAMSKNHFQFHYVIGRGGFGKVWKVERKKDKKQFAMKEMNKSRVISKRSVHSVMNEKSFLSILNHP